MLNNLSVMIVDDHPLQLATLSRRLKSMGFDNVRCCYLAEEALSQLASQPADAIFCDLDMPGTDGVELIEQLGYAGFHGDLVVMSALNRAIIHAVCQLGMKLEFSRVLPLPKPISPQALEEIMGELALSAGKQLPRITRIGPLLTAQALNQAFSDQQLINYYQPQVDFHTQKVMKVEALVRWQHPDYGVLTPYDFLPLIAEQDQERRLFEQVLTNALCDIQQQKLDCQVSLNVTQKDIENPEFSSRFLALCRQYRVSPSRFVIEMTEDKTYSESYSLMKNISRLRIHNVGLAIDDFGTGSSSYLKLSRFPFTEIKIDRSFARNCLRDPIKQSIIKSICLLAKDLNVTCVAEGIEDLDTWQLIRDYGVEMSQGYFTGRPMPIGKLALFRDSSAASAGYLS